MFLTADLAVPEEIIIPMGPEAQAEILTALAAQMGVLEPPAAGQAPEAAITTAMSCRPL